MPRPARPARRLAVALLGAVLSLSTSRAAAAEPAPAGTLEEVLQGALASEESFAIAAAEARKAALRSKRALLLLTPEVGLQASWVTSDEQDAGDQGQEGGGVSGDQIGYALTLAQPLYTGGRATAAYRGQRAVEGSTRLEAELARRRALLGAAEAYYGALAAADTLQIARQTLETAEEQHRLASRRVELGEAVLNDQLQAEVRVLRAKGAVAAAQGAVERAREAVRRASGRELAAEPAVPPPQPPLPAAPEQLVAEALANRIELEVGRLGVLAAGEDLREKRGRFLPALGLEASYARTGEEVGDLDWRWRAGINLTLPIYQAGQRLYAVRESEVGVEEARLAAQATSRDIEREVRALASDRAVSAAQLEGLTKQVAAAEEGHRLASRRYAVGLAPSLEVIDAQATLAVARVGRVAELYQLELLTLRLTLALGRDPFPALKTAAPGATP